VTSGRTHHPSFGQDELSDDEFQVTKASMAYMQKRAAAAARAAAASPQAPLLVPASGHSTANKSSKAPHRLGSAAATVVLSAVGVELRTCPHLNVVQVCLLRIGRAICILRLCQRLLRFRNRRLRRRILLRILVCGQWAAESWRRRQLS